ncbi:MAG: hypothetical protein D6767_08935, partial [Candidatus Hydrogenedentota bacterium]
MPDATVAQDLTYDYDAVGNITSIVDNLEPLNSQTFTYDNQYRLKSASGIYGNINYAYTPGGNLVQKGNITFKYGSACATPGPAQAVCEDSEGNSYLYDGNGNMIMRKGRSLVYDSEDRLVRVDAGGVPKLNFIYDYSGQRVVKSREDGTVVYSISGLYEVMV